MPSATELYTKPRRRLACGKLNGTHKDTGLTQMHHTHMLQCPGTIGASSYTPVTERADGVSQTLPAAEYC